MRRIGSVSYSIIYIIFTMLSACKPSISEMTDESRVYMNQGNFGAALNVLDKLILRDPENQAAYNMRGIANLELGNADEAIEDFTTSVILDSGNYKAYYNRGNAFYRGGQFIDVVKDYDMALRHEPKEPDIYINRGNALVQQEKYKEAVYDYEFALKLDGGNYLTHFNLARTHYLLDDLELAKISFERSIELYPAYAPSFYFLGMIALERDDVEVSCSLLKRAAELGYEQAGEVMKLYCLGS